MQAVLEAHPELGEDVGRVGAVRRQHGVHGLPHGPAQAAEQPARLQDTFLRRPQGLQGEAPEARLQDVVGSVALLGRQVGLRTTRTSQSARSLAFAEPENSAACSRVDAYLDDVQLRVQVEVRG